MEGSYKITATGIAPERQHQAVHSALQKMLRADPAAFDKTFQRLAAGQAVVLVKGLSEAQAQASANKLMAIGLLCQVEEVGLTLVAKTYRCPACDFEQNHHTDGTPDVCSKCGVVIDSYTPPPETRRNELKEALERERRALSAESRLVSEKETAEAERKRAAKLRKIARRKIEAELGITRRYPWLTPKVLIPVVTILLGGGGVTGWLLWEQQREQEAAAAATAAAVASSGGTQLTITPPPGLSVNVAANPSTGVSDPAIDNAVGGDGTAMGGAVGATVNQANAPFAVALPSAAAVRGSADASDPAVLAVKSDSRMLTSLAFYRLDNGDLGTAAKLLDRVTLRFNDKTTTAAPEQLQRDTAQLRAELAAQFMQRNDFDNAQAQWKRANRIATAITIAAQQALAYSSLGRINQVYPALAATQDYFKLAKATAGRSALTPLAQVEVLSTLARELTLAGQAPAGRELLNQATAAVKQLQERSVQVAAQALLAQRLAEVGDLAAATTTLTAAADPAPLAQRVTALAALALKRAQQGEKTAAQTDFNAALAQAAALPDPLERGETFIFIARQLAQAGNAAAAEQIIAVLGQ